MCVCVYVGDLRVFIFFLLYQVIHRSLSLSLSIYIYIYIYIKVKCIFQFILSRN